MRNDMDNGHRELTNTDFARRFDLVANSFDEIISGYSAFRRYNALLPYIRGSVLSAGTGTGGLKVFYESAEDILNLDISFNMCRVAKNKTGAPAVCADAEDLPVADRTFDTIVGSEMIYYLNSPERFFKEAFRILKPGGTLLVTSANQKTVFYDKLRTLLRFAGFSRAYFDDGARQFMTSKQLQRLFIGNGFKVTMMRRILTIPFESLRWLDKRIENTRLSRFAMFIVMAGVKSTK